MSRLSNFERETIINFNEAEKVAFIFTYNKSWQAHLEKVLKIKPLSSNGYGGREYQLPKKFIKLPRGPVILSDAEKKRRGEQMKKLRQQQR